MTLDDALLKAHAQGDQAALVVLYSKAAEATEAPDAERFFLTQAYVFALEIGSAEAGALKARLVQLGGDIV